MNSSVWERLLSYHSTESVQKKLEKVYEKHLFTNSSSLSYDNCYRFVYFLKHGENFFLQATHSPHAIQPMMLFYGLSQLLKACILVKDPEYPATSSVLAHGVSSRKRKKQQYQFLKDEIKIQRNGLFSHVAEKLFDIKHMESEKYSMDFLLKQIAEMNEIFAFHHSNNYFVPIESSNEFLFLTDTISQSYHMSLNRLAEYLTERYPYKLITDQNNTGQKLKIKMENPNALYKCFPFSYHFNEERFYLPNDKENLLGIPEILVHYLLLYNLSMISRYETEWWYDLLLGASNDDYPFILRYMEIAKRKIPFLILNYLNQNL